MIFLFSLKEKFLDDGIDVPFYNDVPKLSTFDWIVVLASVLLVIGYITVIDIPADLLPFAVFLTGLIPALYICKGNYSLFFKRLRLKDIGLAVVLVICIYVYTIIMGLIISLISGNMAGHAGLGEAITAMSVLAMIIQVFGEEFFKIFLLLLVMYVIYKFTRDRGMALLLGLILSMIIFGLVHYDAYEGRILQILLIQGFGSVFEYYAYLKTKNVWVCFLVHVLRDFIPIVMSLLNVLPAG